jgi:hypothetical protein
VCAAAVMHSNRVNLTHKFLVVLRVKLGICGPIESPFETRAALPGLCAVQAFGRIRHNKLVYFAADAAALRGKLVQVRNGRVCCVLHCKGISLISGVGHLIAPTLAAFAGSH